VLTDLLPSELDDVGVEVEYPRIPDPDDLVPWRRARKMLGPEFYDFLGATARPTAAGRPPRRDGFFWFLFASTIVLLLLLGTLVAAAVIRTYFP
jgi:hypothetical protein